MRFISPLSFDWIALSSTSLDSCLIYLQCFGHICLLDLSLGGLERRTTINLIIIGTVVPVRYQYATAVEAGTAGIPFC